MPFPKPKAQPVPPPTHSPIRPKAPSPKPRARSLKAKAQAPSSQSPKPHYLNSQLLPNPRLPTPHTKEQEEKCRATPVPVYRVSHITFSIGFAHSHLNTADFSSLLMIPHKRYGSPCKVPTRARGSSWEGSLPRSSSLFSLPSSLFSSLFPQRLSACHRPLVIIK